MCEQGTVTPVRVKIPADLACSGKEHWKEAQIDSCIASLVDALQRGGIDMRGSCCGHGKTFGTIDLQDGRMLLILSREHALRYLAKAGDDAASAEVLLAAMRVEPAPGFPPGL